MLFDWDALEEAWFGSVIDSTAMTVRENPGECFYAGAFWLLYGNYRSILVPAFGLSSERCEPDSRWHPPDWRWSPLDAAHEAVRPLYRPLLRLEVDAPTYEALWERHIDVLAKVSHRVTDHVRSAQLAPSTAFSPRFFVGIIDFAQGQAAVDYLRRSVDTDTLRAVGLLFDET